MKITAAICTYNREKYLPMVMDSILKQTISRSDFEIIVIDNNSPGNTKEIIEEYKKNNEEYSISYFLETNQGLSHARNRSIKESNCPLITFIDDDAFLDENYLAIIIDEFERNSELSAIGGKILLHYETVIPKWENKYLNSLLGFYSPGEESFIYPIKGGNLDYPRGSNMAFRNSIFDQIGNFNIELGRQGGNLVGGEEKDIFFRLYESSNPVVKYVPNALIFHSVPVERTTKEFIIRQALGTGKSEKIRAENISRSTVYKSYFKEFLKWGATIALAGMYLLQMKPQRSKMLVVFRYWVSKGLILN